MLDVQIMYIVQQITDECLARRDNSQCYSPAGLNKSTGIASMIKDTGYKVTVLSPSFVNNKTGKVYKSFHEKYHEYDLFHSLVWDIPFVNMLTCIVWISYKLFTERKSYNKILFYNYTPETAIPSFFAKIILNKKIYVEYEDGFFALDIFKPLKWIIAANEIVGNYLISGAILVTKNLKSRVKSKNIQIIPGIIDQTLYNQIMNLPPKKTDTKIIMYSGGLDEIRGINLFLEIAENIINKKKGKYEFWITGKGPLEQLVRDYTKKYPKQIRYHGFISRNELINMYAHVDFFLSLQKPEHKFSAGSSPSKAYEFISTGKVCMGLIDLDVDYENYLFFEDVQNLENKIIEFIGEPFKKMYHLTKSRQRISIFSQ